MLGRSGNAQGDPTQAARALEQQGRLSEAEDAWKALAKSYPSRPEPLAEIGLLEAKQTHYSDAVTWYRKALAINAALPGLKLNLGLAYFKAGDYRNALNLLEPLLKANPDDARLTLLVGMAHYGLAQFGDADPLLKQASASDPANATLLLTLAHSCLLSNDYACVTDAYHKLIGLNSESAEADMLVGEALDAMKDGDGAIREFRAAVTKNPKEPNVHFGLGYLLWKRNDYESAAAEFRAEAANDAANLQAKLYLADCDTQLNHLDEARELLESLEHVGATSYMQHLDLGTVHEQQGRKDAAVAEMKAAVKLDPAASNAHWRLARLYRSMGKAQEAKAEFEKTRGANEAQDEKLLRLMSHRPEANAIDDRTEKHQK